MEEWPRILVPLASIALQPVTARASVQGPEVTETPTPLPLSPPHLVPAQALLPLSYSQLTVGTARAPLPAHGCGQGMPQTGDSGLKIPSLFLLNSPSPFSRSPVRPATWFSTTCSCFLPFILPRQLWSNPISVSVSNKHSLLNQVLSGNREGIGKVSKKKNALLYIMRRVVRGWKQKKKKKGRQTHETEWQKKKKNC